MSVKDPGGRSWPRVRVAIGDDCIIGPNVHLGLVREAWAREEKVPSGCAVTIADGCTISANVVIHDSSSLESSCFVDDGCRVGYGCRIGAATRLEYGAFIGDRVAIGESCVIAGFVCDGVVIGRRVIAMGNFVHKLSAPHEPWGAIESAAVVEDGAVVGLGATVVGGVTIGRGSYVAAAALVSKDVPPHSVVTGVNAVTAMSDWQGSELRMGL